MRVLISGAGIAGPTLAYWLVRYGFEPTLIEMAPKLRTGGYVIDFWGAGFDVADRMGLLPEITRKGYAAREIRVVDRSGKKVAAFPADSFSRATHGRYTSLARGDLAASIFRLIEGKVETIFGDTIDAIAQDEKIVRVTFRSGLQRDFDLVVGADGLHSRVRELVFGPQTQFEKYLGYKAAAFEIEHYQPRDELVYVMFTEVGQQIVRFAMDGDRTMFLFTFADENVSIPVGIKAQKQLLRERFGKSGWECPQILNALDTANNFYFDRVSQIRMDTYAMNEHPTAAAPCMWSRGRVTLVGDAASCVSLLAGQGSSLAMVAAYILGGELARAKGNYTEAFLRYQNLFAPFVRKKQKSALLYASSFAPKSRFALFLRNQIFNLMRIPWLAELAVSRDLADKITLPDYPASIAPGPTKSATEK